MNWPSRRGNRRSTPPASTLLPSDMSGSGRPRTSSFAEPQGASGAAAASAGTAAVVGSNTGKSGVSQASADNSSACANFKLASEYMHFNHRIECLQDTMCIQINNKACFFNALNDFNMYLQCISRWLILILWLSHGTCPQVLK